jgi:multisubunit Na+/H+ antiporter MnhG subunit
MRLKLKEDPKEWRKFSLVWCAVLCGVSFLTWRKQVIGDSFFYAVVAVMGMAGVIAVIVPRLFRRFYRVGMMVSFHLGQFMGKVILSLVFIFVVTPMGLLLRAMGKDLLDLKRAGEKKSYWKPARRIGRFDQQF